ncbi:MAG: beta-lactamase family protein [Desulfobacterales bacterium]|nr:beta-lactamase family protein [Desulfobacterales bacterium]
MVIKLFSYRIFYVSFFIISCLLFACAPPKATVQKQPEILNPMQQFEQKLESMRKAYNVPGMSVAILKEQEVVFNRGFGYADLENKIPATENTPYNIASLTKPFGATILMNLVEEAQLSLDDAMADILNETDFKYGDHSAQGYADLCKKIRKLAWLYGSLLWDYRCHTEKILVRHHLTHTSQGMPGERYRYNGFLFTFLSKVAEKTSGKAFDELLVEKIIAPLEMTRTIPSINEERRSQTLKHRAKYYQIGPFGGFVSSKYPVRLSTSAGMVSTVVDIAKFDVAMDRNEIISKESKETMYTPTISTSGKILPYGLGWFVQEYKGIEMVWHYGYAPKAYSSLILKIPEKELTMILLANSDGASRGFNLGNGNVLNSPFARLFVNMFIDTKTIRQ